MSMRTLHATLLPYYALIAVAFNAFAHSSMVRSTTAGDLPSVRAQANSLPIESRHAAGPMQLGFSEMGEQQRWHAAIVHAAAATYSSAYSRPSALPT